MIPPTASPSFDAPYDGDLQADLELALRVADAADAVSMARFDAPDLDVRLKSDATHVTEADLATEEAIRAVLEAFPADAPPTVIVQHIPATFSGALHSRNSYRPSAAQSAARASSSHSSPIASPN